MKKLKMLLESGVIQGDKKLNALYKDFLSAKKKLKKAESKHLKSKSSFKELEKDSSVEQAELEASYLKRMIAKHLRSAAEYNYLMVESNLKNAIDALLKGKSAKKTKSKSKDKSSSKKSKSKKSKKKKKSKSPSVKTIRTVTVESSSVDPFVKREAVAAPAKKRGRGRPPGAKNKVKSDTPPAPKRGRGRPPGAKNKVKSATTVSDAPKRGRGRPPGAKNKPKVGVSTGIRRKPGPKPKPRPVVDGDDLRLIEGVGPAAMRNLKACGFDTFAKIAKAKPQQLYDKLTAISQRMAVLALDSFPQQAKLAAAKKWDELEAYQKTLSRGR